MPPTPFHTPEPLTDSSLIAEATRYLREAGNIAGTATCLRARCGTVVVNWAGEIVGAGSNGLPNCSTFPSTCRKDSLPATFKSDRTCCTHAEVRALLAAGKNAIGATLYFTRVDADGNLIPSGEPYCTICSKMALEMGVHFFVLQHEYGIVVYPTDVYNELSFLHAG